MKQLIESIQISNFKSIRKLSIDGLNRINLFIGKPNVGKSNILEALGIFSLPYLKFNSNQKLSNLVRAEFINELFYDGDTDNTITIANNLGKFVFSRQPNNKSTARPNSYSSSTGFSVNGLDISISISENLTVKITGNNIESNPFKFYAFRQGTKPKKLKNTSLLPPFGQNLMSSIENIPILKTEIVQLFKEYNLNLVFDRASQELKIMKEQKEKEIFLIPYSSVADTLQRVIFFKTAIASNSNSVLIFEEPEAHAFPPYISHMTQEIIDSTSNQFILSTHSPYVINDFMEHARDELSIFLTDYEDGETKVKKLTREELDEIYQYGVDLLFNHERFL